MEFLCSLTKSRPLQLEIRQFGQTPNPSQKICFRVLDCLHQVPEFIEIKLTILGKHEKMPWLAWMNQVSGSVFLFMFCSLFNHPFKTNILLRLSKEGGRFLPKVLGTTFPKRKTPSGSSWDAMRRKTTMEK